MNNAIIYRPYKTQTWALMFTISIGILAFVGAGYCLPLSGVGVLCLIGIGIVCIWLTKVLYDASKSVVLFDENGIHMIGDSYFGYQCISWEKLAYAYYARNYKGHLFLILSPDTISQKEARHLANQGAKSSRICIGDAMVIYIDILQDTSQLREIIDNRVPHIDVY